MTLQEIIDGIKRDSQTGEVGNNADTTASDILRKLNDARLEVWNMNPWDWSKVDIGPIVVPAGSVTPVSLDPAVGEIIVMGIVGQPGELDSFTEKEYRKWRKLGSPGINASPALQTDAVIGFVHRGRDAAGNLKVLFVNAPATATNVEGEGKLRLIPVRYAVADIATTAQIDYFPDEVQPILVRLAYGRFLDSIKDARAAAEIGGALQSFELLKGTNRTDPASDARTHPPDYVRWANRKRGGRTVV